MALRNLRLDGDELLRKKSRDVKKIDEKILTLLDDMAETMRDKNGVGLAAPQVGILKKVVVLDASGDGTGLTELINPEIIHSEGSQINPEGCLSIPGKWGDVERPQKVIVKALDRHGNEVTHEAEGKLAIIFSHEIDHLHGILYKDKVIDGLEDVEPDEDDFAEE